MILWFASDSCGISLVKSTLGIFYNTSDNNIFDGRKDFLEIIYNEIRKKHIGDHWEYTFGTTK